MPFLAVCPCCGRENHVPERALGAMMWCPQCSSFFAVVRKQVTTGFPVPARQRSGPAPFLAACNHCGRESHVPATALGTFVWCPGCSNYFTVAPKKRRSDVRVAALAGVPAAPEAPPEELPVARPLAWWEEMPPLPGSRPSAPAQAEPRVEPAAAPPPGSVEPPTDPGIATPTPISLRPLKETPAAPPSAPEPKAALPLSTSTSAPVVPKGARRRGPGDEDRRDVDPAGAAALGLGCAALLCASLSLLCPLLLPLAVLGTLTGAGAIIHVQRTAASRLTFPIAGTVVSAVVLLLAWLSPSWLGPVYEAFREPEGPDLATIRRVTLPGVRNDPGDDDPGWTDAGRAALAQGSVQVQVLKATVEPVQLPGKDKGKTEPALVVRVRVQKAADAADFAARKQPATPSLAREHYPVLSDQAGKTFAVVDVRAAAAADNPRTGVMVFTDWVFVFEPPPAGASLRLEIPAAAWGGTGSFRFALPASMVQR